MLTTYYNVDREDYLNAGKISSQIKKNLKELGLDNDLLRRIAVACYEAEINMVIHSYGGKIGLKIDEDYIELSFIDVGPGIKDLKQAFVAGYSTANDKARSMGFGAGMGLNNIKRVSDKLDIETSEKGTSLILGFKI